MPRGRKPLPNNKKRDMQIGIYVTRSEHKAIHKLVKNGETVSDYGRRLIMNAVKRNKKS